jgi:twitching motility protein PilT
LKWKDTLEFTQSIITEKQHDQLMKTKNLDFSFTFSNRRFRVNISFQLSNYMIVFRLLTADIPNIDKLELPDIYKDSTKLGQ